MADLVQRTVEAMVPDLLFLMRRRVFTKQEIKDILKIRENFEYTFLRKSSSKKDYLKAIEYEYELEDERKRRFKALKLKKQTTKDFSIIRRIIFLFDRLTAKYQHDIAVWKEYCLFCNKIRANRMFFKAVSNAIAVNWDSLDLWLLAVYYHFETNKDPFKARRTFLRALKINNNRKDFWLEYFRFELNFLEKIKQRKNMTVMGGEEGDAEEKDKMEVIGEEEKEGDDNDEGLMMFDDNAGEQEKNGKKSKDKKKSAKKGKDLPEGDFVGFGGEEKPEEDDKGLPSDEADSLALLIYESIIDVFPSDSKINSELLQICNEFKGEWIEKVKEEIFKVLKEKFSDYPLANMSAFLEMRCLNKAAFEKDADEAIFEKANKVILDMEHYFASKVVSKNEEGIAEKVKHDKSLMFEELINNIISNYEECAKLGNPRAQLFHSIISMIIKNAHFKEIDRDQLIHLFEGICQFAIDTQTMSDEIKDLILFIYKLPNIDYVALERIAQIVLKFPDYGLVPFDQLVTKIRKHLKEKKIEIPHRYQANLYIHLMGLENIMHYKEKIVDFLKEAIRYLCYTQGFADFAQEFIKKVMETYPVTEEEVASECFKRLFDLKAGCPPLVSMIYIRKLAEIKVSHPEIKKHLQRAVEWHPENRELWLKLLEWEKKFGNPLLCPDIFQKAQRHIKDSSFVHEYTSLLSS